MGDSPEGKDRIDADIRDAARQENPKEKHRKFSQKKWNELVANAAWLLEHGTEIWMLFGVSASRMGRGTFWMPCGSIMSVAETRNVFVKSVNTHLSLSLWQFGNVKV